MVGRGRLSCLHSFKTVLEKYDLLQCWRAATVPGDWASAVRAAVKEEDLRAHAEAVARQSSLTLYTQLNHDSSKGAHPYLLDRSNIPGTRLKCHLRLGILWLMDRVASTLKWPPAAGVCLLCRDNCVETAQHFLLECKAMGAHRLHLRVALDQLRYAGVAGRALLDQFDAKARSDPGAALLMLSGEVAHPSRPANVEPPEHAVQCGKAAWLFDRISKDYLVRCWKARRMVVGDLKVSHGTLTRSVIPLRSLPPPVICKPRFRPECRRQWLQWSPLADNVASANRRGTPHGFFVVWCGRQRGVFTRWCDAKASVAGHPDAKFRGFDDHSLATLAFAAGPP